MDPRIHEHSLTFKEEKKNDGPPKFCHGCLEPVLGPHYTCDTCEYYRFNASKFIIHKSCVELPFEIHHPIHPNHPLILTSQVHPYNYGIKCGVCSQLYRQGFYLSYYCSTCKFWIDINCAFKWQKHEHNFTVVRGPIKFACDVCGQGDDILQYNSYICKIYQLIVHRQCSWLPLQVKISLHQHRLKLTWWFQDMYPKDQDYCDYCEEKMNENRVVYCCECRGFTAHCKCRREEGEFKNILVNDDDDEPSTSRPPLANETTADDKAPQIEHFSHQHKLTLINAQEVARQDDQDEGITCNGCTLPIMRGESYRSCTEQEIEKPCNFSLHINCAKLPQKRLLPLHEHELTLLPMASSVGGVFECNMCKSLSQGFSHHCQECNRDIGLDLYCSILYERKTLCHDAHVHTLHFSVELVSCSSCGTRDQSCCFRCSLKICDFHLCIPCVKLPSTVRYKYDDHPLKLTCTSVKNEIQNIGSTPARIVTLNVILIAFEGGIRKSS